MKSLPTHYFTFLFLTLLLLVMTLGTVITWMQPTSPIGFNDPDVWIRLARVQQLYTSGDWYNRTIDLEGPFGVANHWTRPLDVLLLALAYPASFIVPLKMALLGAAAVYNILLLLITAIGISKLCRCLRIGAAGQWAATLLLFQGDIISLFSIGRADHHSLLLCLFVWLLTFLCQYSAQKQLRHILLAGATAGLGLWVSPEFLAAIAGVAIWAGICWLFDLEKTSLKMLERFVLTIIAVTCVAIPLEWPPHQWLTLSYDRISLLHLHMLVVMFFIARILNALPMRNWQTRGGIAGTVCAAAFAWLSFCHPRFYWGAMAETPADLVPMFAKLAEEQPLFATVPPIAAFLMLLGYITVFSYYLRRVLKHKDTSLLLLATMSAIFFALALLMIRWLGYAEVAMLIGWAMLAETLALWLFKQPFFSKQTFNVAIAGAAQALFFIAVLIPALMSGLSVTPTSKPTTPDRTAACQNHMLKLIEANVFSAHTSHPTTVILGLNQAGHLLFWTPHRAIASNYNENAAGIREFDNFWFAQNEREALRVIHKYEVGFIMLCPTAAHSPFFPREHTTPVFLNQILSGPLPTWLESVTLDHADAPLLFHIKAHPLP